MGDAVKEALQTAIETKRRELAELELALRRHEQEALFVTIKTRRRRRKTGFKQGSIPFHVQAILKETGRALTAAELSDELKKRGKSVDSRLVASSLNRYMGQAFDRTAEGAYLLLA
jgi:heme oxygenase